MSGPAGKTDAIYSFLQFTLDLDRGCLLRGNEEVRLRPKVYEALKYLVENNNRLISKNELSQAVWPDSYVTDDSLVQCLVELRRALGDDTQQCIKTVPRRGYIFVAEVTRIGQPLSRFIQAKDFDSVKDVNPEPNDDGTPVIGEARSGGLPGPSGSKLKQLALSVVLLLMVLVSFGLLYLLLRAKEPPTAGIHSIAVLPLANASADPNLDYLSDGITENIIDRLSQLPGLKVMARTTVFRYKGKDLDPMKVGHDLNVGAVLTGAVIQQGSNLDIHVVLVNAADGTQLWGERYSRKLSDILAVQEEIARRVAASLQLTLTGEQQKLLAKHFTENSDAYQHYLRGRYFWEKRSEEGLKKGIQYFQEAIDADPGYASAYAGLADCYLMLFDYSFFPPNDSAPKARAAATKALEIDESLAEAHASLAYFKFSYEWDWSGSEREFKRAIELNPNYATAHHWYGYYLAVSGRFAEGLAEMSRAKEIDPLSLIIDTNEGRLFYWQRDFDAAIERYNRTLEIDSNFSSAREKLAEAYEAKRMYPEAITEYQKWAALIGDNELANKLRETYTSSGYRGAIKAWIDHLGQIREQDYTERARLSAALGDKEQTFYWLEKAYLAHSTWLYQLKVEPAFDGLRSDPRLVDLQRRIGLD